MAKVKPLSIPLLVTDFVEDPPVKRSGSRTINDLDALESLPDDAEFLVRTKERDYRITKAKMLSSLRVADSSWDDDKFPLTGRNIDVVSGRLSFDFYNGVVGFANNARYNIAETVSFNMQLQHKWLEGSVIRPHIHWLQQHATNIPNWLFGHEIRPKGETFAAINTDFTNHTFSVLDSHVFTYASGVLEQISKFPEIDLTGYGISDNIHFCIWRDSANTSGLFSGADPSSLTEYIREYDVHFQIDSLGSNEEFIKD